MNEPIELKAMRYLIEGKVKAWYVAQEGVEAIFDVEGSKANPYCVSFNSLKGWHCDCPSHTECAHIIACKRILPTPQKSKNLTLGTQDDDITEFLNQF